MKKNTFYEKKEYREEPEGVPTQIYDTYKYVRVDDVIDDVIYFTYFTENSLYHGGDAVGSQRGVTAIEWEERWTEIPKTLHTLCVGDTVYNGTEFRKVLGVINQNCYAMSCSDRKLDHKSLLRAAGIYTIADLEHYSFKPYEANYKTFNK